MIKILPRKYSKKEFIVFLQQNNVNVTIIDKFKNLPDTLKRNGGIFDMYISSTWYNVGNPYYSYELNYYSDELIEFMFNSKVFNDVELSINYMICEINKIKS